MYDNNIIKTPSTMSTIDKIQALRDAIDEIVSVHHIMPIDQLMLMLDEVQNHAKGVSASVPSMDNEEMSSTLLMVKMLATPLLTIQQEMTKEYSTYKDAYFAAEVDTPAMFEQMRTEFLASLPVKTRKLFLEIPSNELSSYHRRYNIPPHAGNFVTGLVTGGASVSNTEASESKKNQMGQLLKLLNEYNQAKRKGIKDVYDEGPTVAPLLALIDKVKKTATAITNITGEILRRRAMLRATHVGNRGMGIATELDYAVTAVLRGD